ncbi:hypothetical protein B5C34_08825 [Pacificimonas flava]|uniref:Magnesium transporter MgtE intracellular domain-containing protein n=2 Tax=Pacificimonas TaxID=1960290 RepID=A0A219B5A3_9SPHN|nr:MULTISPECIES: hypothetical protein [Pacificimonas]MBZ6379231.1 hypothetical protein [Pacificimonas aurantium]OWV33555.1 hypothetical protein B5C34_08825 [Pacificimonas flava]
MKQVIDRLSGLRRYVPSKRITFLPLMAAAAATTALTHALAVGAAETKPAEIEAEASSVAENRMSAAIRGDLEKRDVDAAQQARALKLRERSLAAAEKRISDAAATEEQAEEPAAEEDPQAAQYDSLARIYQTMKPKKAAAVFEQLDLTVQVEVSRRMRERSVALVIANMGPKQAAALTMALAQPAGVPAASGTAKGKG